MSDSCLNEAERPRQPPFRFKWLILLAFLAGLAGLLRSDPRQELPDRKPRPPAVAAVRFTAVPLPAFANRESWKISGTWRLESDEPRFAGLSALLDDGPDRLVALTDSGVLVGLPKPGTRAPAMFRDLPGGPGVPTYKKYRDSEAMLRHAGALFVAFENRHSLFVFAGNRVSGRWLPAKGWSRNTGVEAMVMTRSGLLMLPEESDDALLLGPDGRFRRLALVGRTGGIADAARLPDGRILVAVREIGLTGIRNRLAWLRAEGKGLRLVPFATLPLDRLDNVEGLAAERLANGATRLWAVTDNDDWRRTLLIRIDMPKAPESTGASTKSVSR